MTSPPATMERIGLIAGEGRLPVHVAQNARRSGLEVVALTMSGNNRKALHQLCGGQSHAIVPGMVEKTLTLLKTRNIRHVVFAGKVNKWVLLKNPRLDERGWRLLKSLERVNDDGLMLALIRELENEGISVLRQTDYLRDLFLPEGTLTRKQPTDRERGDIRYGFHLAKEMGRLDVGQSVVVKDGMILAVEAIEGTDECLKRAGHWARKKGGVVVKVAKPEQDQRFDVPTVGLRTLKTMRKAGLRVLAVEANETLFLEPAEMVAFADRHDMVITCVSGTVTDGRYD